HLPGAYLVKQADRVVASAVVNIDPRESDPRPIALESLKSGQGAVVTVLRDEDELLLAGKTRPLWPELACAAALFLALEMLLLALWRRPALGGDHAFGQGDPTSRSPAAGYRPAASEVELEKVTR